MRVERRRRFAARHHRTDTIEPRQQRFELRWHFEDDLGAMCCDQRRVARELNGVAETLLGVKEDGLAVKRKVAKPQTPAAALRRGDAGAPPAPFVVRKAAAIIAESEPRQGAIKKSVGI